MRTFWCGLVVARLFSQDALTAQTEWIKGTDGFWSEPSAWSAGPPTAASTLTRLANPGSKTVTINSATAEANLTIDRFELSGSGAGTNTLLITGLGANRFRLLDSFHISAGGVLRIVDSGVVLDGTSSGGTFSLNEGALFLAGGSFEVVAAVARIGRTGQGAVHVSGGEFRTSGDLVIGGLPGSNGRVEVTGGTLTAGGLVTVGDNADSTGSLTIKSGAVFAPNMRVGDDGPGLLLVEGGSVQGEDVSISRSSGSTGTFQLKAGTFESGDLSIGRFPGAQGRLEVSGGRLSLTNDTLFVGREGAGVAAVSGGMIEALEVVLASTNSAQGTLILDGGAIVTGSLLANGPAASIQFSSGILESHETLIATGQPLVVGDGIQPATLRLGGGTHRFPNGLVISANARIEGCGMVVGSLTVLGTDARCGAPGLNPVITFVQKRGLDILLRCESVPGKTYRVEATAALGSGAWAPAGPEVSGTGGILEFAIGATAPVQFYRIAAR